MNKEQIEGMTELISEIRKYSVYSDEIAEALWNAGYRKQSEGKWVKESFNNTPSCSICGIFTTFRSKFCPNCGAKMRENEKKRD